MVSMRILTASIHTNASVNATNPSRSVQAIDPWIVGERFAFSTVAP